MFLATATFEVCEFFLFRHSKKSVCAWVCMGLRKSREESSKLILFTRSKFSFLFAGI